MSCISLSLTTCLLSRDQEYDTPSHAIINPAWDSLSLHQRDLTTLDTLKLNPFVSVLNIGRFIFHRNLVLFNIRDSISLALIDVRVKFVEHHVST